MIEIQCVSYKTSVHRQHGMTINRIGHDRSHDFSHDTVISHLPNLGILPDRMGL